MKQRAIKRNHFARMPWTSSDAAKCLRLKAEGKLTNDEIGKKLGRSRESVVAFIFQSKLTPEENEGSAMGINNARRGKREDYISTGEAHDVYVIPSARPTAEMLLERDKRIYQPPRDLSAALFGDPPVGHSALERRT